MSREALHDAASSPGCVAARVPRRGARQRGRTRCSQFPATEGCLEIEKEASEAAHAAASSRPQRGASTSRKKQRYRRRLRAIERALNFSSRPPVFRLHRGQRLLKRGEDRFALLFAKVHEGNDDGSKDEEHDKEHGHADGPCGKAII